MKNHDWSCAQSDLCFKYITLATVDEYSMCVWRLCISVLGNGWGERRAAGKSAATLLKLSIKKMLVVSTRQELNEGKNGRLSWGWLQGVWLEPLGWMVVSFSEPVNTGENQVCWVNTKSWGLDLSGLSCLADIQNSEMLSEWLVI